MSNLDKRSLLKSQPMLKINLQAQKKKKKSMIHQYKSYPQPYPQLEVTSRKFPILIIKVKYCNTPIVLLYIIALSNKSPSLLVNGRETLGGMEHFLDEIIYVRLNNSAAHLL